MTGSSGFIGAAICEALTERGYLVRRAARRGLKNKDQQNYYVINEIGPNTQWSEGVKGIDLVIHLAAHVHIAKNTKANSLEIFRRVNVEGTARLARIAALAGVKRFIYLSSVKVNGEISDDKLFSENDAPNPRDPYAISKWEAEQALQQIEAETDMEIIVIRPPLVYGPGVKANFLQLIKWVDSGVPMPLALIQNRRSMIALDNLIDFIMHCASFHRLKYETFLISDGEDISTPDLILRIAASLGRRMKLFPFPISLIRLGAPLTGKKYLVDRVCNSLQVDISKAKKLLGWQPVVSVDEGLRKTVNWYMEQKS